MTEIPEPADGTNDEQPAPVRHLDRDAAGAPSPHATADSPDDQLADVAWEVAYDREGVTRFIAEVEAERARLLDEIAEARRRADEVEAAASARRAAAQVELGELVLAAQAELVAVEQEHAELVESIRAAAKAEAARVLEAARVEASAIRGATASLSSLVHGGTGDRVVDGTAFAPSSPPARSDAG